MNARTKIIDALEEIQKGADIIKSIRNDVKSTELLYIEARLSENIRALKGILINIGDSGE